MCVCAWWCAHAVTRPHALGAVVGLRERGGGERRGERGEGGREGWDREGGSGGKRRPKQRQSSAKKLQFSDTGPAESEKASKASILQHARSSSSTSTSRYLHPSPIARLRLQHTARVDQRRKSSWSCNNSDVNTYSPCADPHSLHHQDGAG